MQEKKENQQENLQEEDDLQGTLSSLMKRKSGLKINNDKSLFKQEKSQKIDFRQRVNDILKKEDEQKQLSFELNSKYQQILKDKTLDSEKTSSIRDSEKEIIKDLIDFSRIINSDEQQTEDIGTISLLVVLLRNLLLQRDRINELEFVHNKTLKELEIVKALLKSKLNTTE